LKGLALKTICRYSWSESRDNYHEGMMSIKGSAKPTSSVLEICAILSERISADSSFQTGYMMIADEWGVNSRFLSSGLGSLRRKARWRTAKLYRLSWFV
jgi:hypothetical protein